jgi:hypothetical protein
MDLQLTWRVIWRFKFLVAMGLMLAFALAFLSMVRVSLSGSPHFAYKTQPTYESLTTVFVTSHGFPYGSLNLRAGSKATDAPPGSVDTGQLRDFAIIYLQYAQSDAVKRMIARQGGLDGIVQAFPVFAQDSSVLPIITLSAISTTPDRARSLARRHLAALESFLVRNQQSAGIAPDDRVIIQPVNGPQPAHLLQARKKTKAIMIFLATSIGVLALAFMLENFRPRARPVTVDEVEHAQLPEQITRPAA